MAKYFITGGTGCVGSNMIKKLIQQGHEVHALVFPGTWHPFLNGLKFKYFYGDITNKNDVMTAMKSCDYVYHVAGIVSYNLIDHKKIFNVHVNGTRNVLDIAKKLKIKKVVVTVSTAGIGIPENKRKPLTENSPFNYKKYKKVMYMYSKHIMIKLCEKFAKKGLNVSMVSPTTIYGQGDTTMHIGKTIQRIKKGKLKIAPPGGNSVVSVDDVIDAHFLVMKKGKKGENYIFVAESMSYKHMFNIISKLVKVQPIKKVYPYWILPFIKFIANIIERFLLLFNKKPLVSPHSLNFVFKYRYFDPSKAINELGWKPKQDFETAIKKAIDFYEEQGFM